MTDLASSRQFWEEKAKENAYWYVSSAGPYDGRDLAGFWDSGPKIWQDLKDEAGYQPQREHTVVEIGCGVGRLTRAIAPEVGQLHSFDISSEMLKIARASVTADNVTFHQAETPSLQQIPSSSVDAFVAYCVFQHLPDLGILETYLKTAARVLRPGGVLIFTLTPRTWRDQLVFLLRIRRWLVELRRNDGPRGLYKGEWYGIRPNLHKVENLSSIRLTNRHLHGDKWLFFGRR